MRENINFTDNGQVTIEHKGFQYGVSVYGSLGGGTLELLDTNGDQIDALSIGDRSSYLMVTKDTTVKLSGATTPDARITFTQLD